MSLDSVPGHTATATAGYLSTIASIGAGGREAGGRESVDAILARLHDGAEKALHRNRDAALATAPVAAIRGGLAPWQVLRVRTHVEAHLDSTVRARDLAAMVRLSAGHFCRAFKRSLGVAPIAYIAGRRVACAQNLMLATDEPLSQIALACGFYDQAHLTRVFRRYAGTSPHDWRRRHRDDRAPVAAPRPRADRQALAFA